MSAFSIRRSVFWCLAVALTLAGSTAQAKPFFLSSLASATEVHQATPGAPEATAKGTIPMAATPVAPATADKAAKMYCPIKPTSSTRC